MNSFQSDSEFKSLNCVLAGPASSVASAACWNPPGIKVTLQYSLFACKQFININEQHLGSVPPEGTCRCRHKQPDGATKAKAVDGRVDRSVIYRRQQQLFIPDA